MRVEILGVPIDGLDFDAALERAWAFLDAPGPHLVFTPNPEILLAAQHDPELRATLCAADLSLPDGVGVVWAARRLGRPVPERTPGIDFFLALLGRAAAEGRSVYFLGTRPERVARAAEEAVRRFPGLQVAGYRDVFFPAGESAAVASAVAASGAELLFAGLGAPKEQRWLAANRGRLGLRLAMGVGGSFDVLAGAVQRAPRLFQRLGVEWLWRLALEPRRWRRQLALPRFVWEVWRSR